MTPENSSSSRREFLKTSSAATVGASVAAGMLIPRTVHAGGSETLKVGLIGCGGRGRGAAIDALHADPHVELTAVGDTFRDRIDETLDFVRSDENVSSKVNVDEDHIFTGFDNYKQVVDSGVDVVILATPPHFRPQHLEYLVDAGKHCFCEKPVGVDPQGVHRVRAACDKARANGLSIVSGLMLRYDMGCRETVRRIHDGAVGDIVAIQSSYNAGTLWHRGDSTDWSRMEYQIRNWLYYTWLSGDHIVEQAIHSLDRVSWLLGNQTPLKAYGMGGRQQRTDPKWGHIFDHHSVVFEFPENRRVYFTCRQQDNVSYKTDEHVLGTIGQADLLQHKIHGPNQWKYREKERSGYRIEHEELFASIRNGEPKVDEYMCDSTMIAIMGRMATYTGKVITWEDCIDSDARLGPEEYAWTDVPEPPVPVPGVTSIA